MKPVDVCTEYMYSHDLSEKSREWYDMIFKEFCRFTEQQGIKNFEDLTVPNVRDFVDSIRERTNPRTHLPVGTHTVHAYARGLRALLHWAAKEELVPDRLARKLVMPKREVKPIGIFSNQHFEWLIRAAEQTRTPLRDKAMLYVLLDTGIRANELCTLTLDNVHFTPTDAWINVHGKGNKWREVGLGVKSRNMLHRYIHRERDSDLPYVFVGMFGKLSPNGLDQYIYRLRNKIGREHFQGVRVSAHTFRHTFACRYLEQGGDIYKLSRILGHTSVVVTENYLRSMKQSAARKGNSVLDNL